MTEPSGNGESLTIEQAIANLQGDDLGLRFYAAWWLGKFRVQSPEAVDRLIEALHDEDDRTDEGGYPLRRNAARALGKMSDRRAVPALIDSLTSSDWHVREAAGQSLELLGDPSVVPALIQQLQRGLDGNTLIAQQPDLSEPYDAYLEAIGTLRATDAIPHVEPFLTHPTPRIRYAAARAMYQLTGENHYGDILVKALDGDDLQLRRSALSDLGAIGYLNAAEAIANTLAENSLKLIALNGLLEHQVKTSNNELSEDTIRVMTLMDDLL